MKLKPLFLGLALAATAPIAFATPQYHGETAGTAAMNPFTATDATQGNGYYIWSNPTDSSSWSVRWIAPVGNESVVSWFGTLEFLNNSLNTVTEVGFETSGQHADDLDTFSFNTADIIDYTAATNNTGGVDGFDFTVNSDFELLTFNLGSSLFSGLELDSTDPGVAGSMIYIGAGYETPDVLVLENNKGKYQRFEVSVPEPGTLALLGLGLAGLGLTRKRKA